MSDPSQAALTAELKAEALRLGFDAVGIAPASAPPGYPAHLEWLDAGYAAGMAYLHGQLAQRAHPENLLPGARSVVVVLLSYADENRGEDRGAEASSRTGKIARYARGLDYHEIFWRRLESLLSWLRTRHSDVQGRAVCDSAPLMERDFAREAGLGWIAKNTMLINRALGSYTLIGSLLVDIELPYDRPFSEFHCGSCTRCLDACPTSAFPRPGVLDARRCISYLTIEHRGEIPSPLAESLQGWFFGCDICQEVCPWNRKAASGTEPSLQGRGTVDLLNWIDQLAQNPASLIKGRSLSRARRAGLLRNAILILGTRRLLDALPVLTGLMSDPEEMVRSATAWAIRRIEGGST